MPTSVPESRADNPLLAHGGLPDFAAIQPDHVVPAVTQLLAELDAELTVLEATAQPTWPGLVEPLERLQDRLEFTWGTVGHLLGVRNTPALREAHEAMQPAVITFSMRLGQSEPLYKAFRELRDGGGWRELDRAQQRIVTASLRDAELSGIGLRGEAKERFNAIQMEMAELSTRFANHVLDATKAWSRDLTQAEDVAGLPQSLLQLAAQTFQAQTFNEQAFQAQAPDSEAGGAEAGDAVRGPWRITLDHPSFGPFLQHSRRRDLREQVYLAYVTRASSGDLDNSPLLRQILALRREMAQLLGFEDYAALSLHSKMAPSVTEVQRLLEELRVASRPAAEHDLQELQAFAKTAGAPEADDLKHWDVAFWAERLREARYDFRDEELRPYFPLPRVLDGLFALVQRLFGAVVRAADGEVPVWHPDVRFFRVYDEAGKAIAAFFLDPYSRPADKRGGAWMNECVGRSSLFGTPEAPVRLPVAYLVCNQTPPLRDTSDGTRAHSGATDQTLRNQPSLMTFREVETLFHEFGHGLQHMLTTVDQGLSSGIRNVEWDAVELPSQFMENWCFHRPTLASISGHVETQAPLPDALFGKILAARTFRAGSDMLRQLMLAQTDLLLHHGYDPEGSRTPFDVHREVAARTAILPPLTEDRFLCSFTHVFAGGYAAGYYSYKWAEVLSADAFAAFEEAGLDDPAAVAFTGRQFRNTVLALGGSQHPMEVFEAFRGRGPSTEALLRHSGLT